VDSHFSEAALDLPALLGRALAPADRTDHPKGALVVFVGTVRDRQEGRPVAEIVYSAYRPLAETVLGRIESELEAEHAGLQLRIAHRLGAVAAGEPSVAILATAPHRAAAYAASRRALERLKAEAPIWKRERYTDGESRWREEEPLRA
jgi:molybdopterin synthase catalytic subunit